MTAKGEGRGRPLIGVERMLRMYIAQPCFGLSDEGAEDAIYKPKPSAASMALISHAKPHRMPPPCSNSGGFWKKSN